MRKTLSFISYYVILLCPAAMAGLAVFAMLPTTFGFLLALIVFACIGIPSIESVNSPEGS